MMPKDVTVRVEPWVVAVAVLAAALAGWWTVGQAGAGAGMAMTSQMQAMHADMDVEMEGALQRLGEAVEHAQDALAASDLEVAAPHLRMALGALVGPGALRDHLTTMRALMAQRGHPGMAQHMAHAPSMGGSKMSHPEMEAALARMHERLEVAIAAFEAAQGATQSGEIQAHLRRGIDALEALHGAPGDPGGLWWMHETHH